MQRKETKSANYKFLLEESISETFEFTLFQTRMRNKSALFRAFISDFIANSDFYKTRLNSRYGTYDSEFIAARIKLSENCGKNTNSYKYG